MPVTAKHVCRDYKIKCDIPRLMKDPAYNTMLGSAYISDRMDEFTGSYVLTLAGYNAGPGRAREWIKEFGDPRDGKVDPIDWIHRIPFEETREYVQKVLSNIQVYRARLGEEANAVRLNADLKRISAAPVAERRRRRGRSSTLSSRQLVAGIRRSTAPSATVARLSPLISAARWIPGTSPGMTRRGVHRHAHAELDRHPLHLARRAAALRAALSGAGLAAAAGRVPGRASPATAATSTTSPARWHGRTRPAATSIASTIAGAGARSHDPDWKNYSILVELNDVLDFMAMKGLAPRRRHRHLARRADRHADGRAAPDCAWAPSCSTTSAR